MGMSTKKKWVSTLLAVVLISVPLAACASKDDAGGQAGKPAQQADANINPSGLPIVKNKVTLNFVTKVNALQKKPTEDLAVVKAFEDKTNVHINWTAIPTSGYDEKKNLIFASNDLPDAFYGRSALTDSDLITYGSQGVLIPLEGLIKQYAPNIQEIFDLRPDIKKAVTASDGHIYSIPTVEDKEFQAQHESLLINKKWLDKLGLQVPQTLDEFEQVLKAFKEKDPNGNGKPDEIPFSFVEKKGGYHIYPMFGSFGRVDNEDHIVVENGKTVFTADKPEYKEAVQWFHKLYSEGLIDPEVFTQDQSVLFSKGKNKDVPILGTFVDWSQTNVVADRKDDYVPVPPLKGPKGIQVWLAYQPRVFNREGFSITSACKQVEVAMRWINQQYSVRDALEWDYGPFGVNIKDDGNNKYELTPAPKGMSYGVFRSSEAPGNTSAAATLSEKIDLTLTPDQMEKDRIYQFYKPYLQKEIYPDIFFSAQDTQELTQLETDIYKYVDQSLAKWVVQGGIENEWDDYVKQLNKMGLDRLVKIYQSNYDRYKNGK